MFQACPSAVAPFLSYTRNWIALNWTWFWSLVAMSFPTLSHSRSEYITTWLVWDKVKCGWSCETICWDDWWLHSGIDPVSTCHRRNIFTTGCSEVNLYFILAFSGSHWKPVLENILGIHMCVFMYFVGNKVTTTPTTCWGWGGGLNKVYVSAKKGLNWFSPLKYLKKGSKELEGL